MHSAIPFKQSAAARYNPKDVNIIHRAGAEMSCCYLPALVCGVSLLATACCPCLRLRNSCACVTPRFVCCACYLASSTRQSASLLVPLRLALVIAKGGVHHAPIADLHCFAYGAAPRLDTCVHSNARYSASHGGAPPSASPGRAAVLYRLCPTNSEIERAARRRSLFPHKIKRCTR